MRIRLYESSCCYCVIKKGHIALFLLHSICIECYFLPFVASIDKAKKEKGEFQLIATSLVA